MFAMRNVQYAASTTSADAQPIGFDLDLGATCTPPPWAAPESDARPIDNAFAAAATRVGALGGVSLNGMYNEVMERGHGTTIFSIWG